MNNKILIGVIAVLAVALMMVLSLRSGEDTPGEVTWPSGAVGAVESMTHAWGDINISGGTVDHAFVMMNTSDTPLVISNAITSCMCTSATIEFEDGEVSPAFGMHTGKTRWEKVVAPGEEFTVRAVFDPMAHGPDSVGPITRSVSIETSAAPDGVVAVKDVGLTKGSIVKVNLSGNVLYEKEFLAREAVQSTPSTEDSYTVKMGDFTFAEEEFDFDVLKQSGGIVSHEFPFIYNGTADIEVTGVPASCACTTAEIDNTSLSQGDEGVLTIEFDPNLHEEPEGRFFKTVSFLTDPALDESPEIKIWAEIDLDLGPEAYKLQEDHDE